MAQAIKKVKGVITANASYRKKAAFVYTLPSMCNKKGQKALLTGLKATKRYSGTIYSMKLISADARPRHAKPRIIEYKPPTSKPTTRKRPLLLLHKPTSKPVKRQLPIILLQKRQK